MSTDPSMGQTLTHSLITENGLWPSQTVATSETTIIPSHYGGKLPRHIDHLTIVTHGHGVNGVKSHGLQKSAWTTMGMNKTLWTTIPTGTLVVLLR